MAEIDCCPTFMLEHPSLPALGETPRFGGLA
jgi:hypothetical protein